MYILIHTKYINVFECIYYTYTTVMVKCKGQTIIQLENLKIPHKTHKSRKTTDELFYTPILAHWFLHISRIQ